MMKFSELPDLEAVLTPVKSDVEGLSAPIEIHRFSFEDIESIIKSDEYSLVDKAIIFLTGNLEEKITDEVRKIFQSKFGPPAMVNIIQKGLEINGVGPAAKKQAEKN